ncbi:MAG: hypothetical protein GKR77_00635 [Legionellales bacterium]|nr:hypothetical protein [Legionellales bacterium]
MYRWLITMVCCSGLLWGCSGKEVQDKRYLKARNAPALQMPPGLSDARVSRYYFLTEPRGNPSVSILPPGSIIQQKDAANSN